MALWFETAVRYDKMQENGSVKKTTERFLVDALTFTDAEARIIEKITPFISGEFSVSAIKKTKVSEVFFDESDYADKWYLVKVNMITFDEKIRQGEKIAFAYPRSGWRFRERSWTVPGRNERDDG